MSFSTSGHVQQSTTPTSPLPDPDFFQMFGPGGVYIANGESGNKGFGAQLMATRDDSADLALVGHLRTRMQHSQIQ